MKKKKKPTYNKDGSLRKNSEIKPKTGCSHCNYTGFIKMDNKSIALMPCLCMQNF